MNMNNHESYTIFSFRTFLAKPPIRENKDLCLILFAIQNGYGQTE